MKGQILQLPLWRFPHSLRLNHHRITLLLPPSHFHTLRPYIYLFLLPLIIIIGLIYWTFMARLIRSQVKVVRERAYVKRAQALGATHTRIIFKHVIPQIAPLLLAQTVLMVALAIFLETAISFLGLGDPSVTSWGKMIETAFSRSAISYGAWWAIAPPGIAVALVIMAFNMVGTAAEDSLNPRLKVSHLSRRHFRLRPLPDKEAPK